MPDTPSFLRHLTRLLFAPGDALRARYRHFKELLAADDRALEIIADLQETFYGIRPADRARVIRLCGELHGAVGEMIARLQAMRPLRHSALPGRLADVRGRVDDLLRVDPPDGSPPHVLSLEEVAGRPELGGGKAANLGRVARESGLPVPPGFVVTVRASNALVEVNGLRPRLDDILAEMRICKHEAFSRQCREMREMVRAARIPESVEAEIREAVRELARKWNADPEAMRFAVRSSAWAEDGEFTFAGQYESVLDVAARDVGRAYLDVLGSKYSRRAVAYRMLRGLSDPETPMAVLVLPMIGARAAGVAYSLDPDVPIPGGGVSVHAVPGLGAALVGGEASGEVFHLTRDRRPAPVGGAVESKTLSPDSASGVAAMSLELERLFGSPQDVEWAQDVRGRIWVLQSRPFRAEEAPAPDRAEPDVSPLLAGLTAVSLGAGSGRILHLHDAQDPAEAPRGSVVVFETLAPSLTRCLDRVEAVIGSSGGRAGHFATVAREYGIPVLVGDPMEITALEEGTLVTVDAHSGCVYPGRLEALVEQAEEMRKKARSFALGGYEPLVPLITALNLTDPEHEDFRPEGCRSMHDLIRYVHERGVGEMFDLVGKSGRGMSRSRKLRTDLPLTVYVLSLDSDLPGGRRDEVRPEDVACAPMREVWDGLESEETRWDHGMHHADWEEFDRVSAGIFSKEARFLSSYALVAGEYMHMLIRFGYHFSILDSVCGPEDKNNYVHFRFKGGGADFDGRLLRLGFIERVLRSQGFTVSIKSDMLDAGLSRKSEAATRRGLFTLGRVMARTRLLDMGLRDIAEVEGMVEEFLLTLESHAGRGDA